MDKELVIYTGNRMYAYNIRTKLLKSDWNTEYISNREDLMEYLSSKDSAVLLIDYAEYSVVKCLKSELGDRLDYFVLVCLDENNCITGQDGFKYVSSLNKITALLPIIENEYLEISAEIEKNKLFSRGVSDILTHFGVSPKYKGYAYLCKCIENALLHQGEFIRYNSQIYPIIADNYHVSVSSIEKSVRKALQRSWEKHPKVFNETFLSNEHVTNNEFMNYVVTHMSRANKYRRK